MKAVISITGWSTELF